MLVWRRAAEARINAGPLLHVAPPTMADLWPIPIPPIDEEALLLALAKALAPRESWTIVVLLGNALTDHWKVVKCPRDDNADVLSPRISQTPVNPSIRTLVSPNGIPVNLNLIPTRRAITH